MNHRILITAGLLVAFAVGYFLNRVVTKNPGNAPVESAQSVNSDQLKLGAFSMSLSVKDLNASREFYEKLGFTAFGGSKEQNYLIMKNGNALIGLFQGMFEGNILTFNPGWDENASNVAEFNDIREIQKRLKGSGLILMSEADENSTGPASLMLTDPDGNMILLDQHR
ncbi:catechol 2,3-dioxygenase [Bacteroidales bacterium 6E]|nr:catechol 2,3-dioxygenase [Bacteroidales bacterium 6E]